MIYHVQQGKHPFRPSVSLNIDNRLGKIAWEVSFGASCRYELPGADQRDYNKLCGVSFCLTTNHKNSAMIGWRYDPDKDRVELAPYCHVAGERMIGPTFLAVPIGEVFTVWFEIDWTQNTVALNASHATHAAHLQPFPCLSKRLWFWTAHLTREIGAWFGGNRTAPHDMYLSKTRLKGWDGVPS